MSVIKNIIDSNIEKFSFDVGDLYEKELVIEGDDFVALRNRIENSICKELLDLSRYGMIDFGESDGGMDNKFDGEYIRREDIIDLFEDGVV